MKAIQVLQKTVHEKNMTDRCAIDRYKLKSTERNRETETKKIVITLGKEQNVCLNVNNNNNVTS